MFHQFICFFLVDNLWRFPFIICRIFNVAEHKDEITAFVRFKRNIQPERTAWLPAVGNGIAGSAVSNGLWCGRGAVCTKKALACGIKSVTRSIYSIDGIVIAAFTVFGFVINAGAVVALYDFDFTGAVIFLKIIHIFNGIPQTEFNIRIKTDVFFAVRKIFQADFV